MTALRIDELVGGTLEPSEARTSELVLALATGTATICILQNEQGAEPLDLPAALEDRLGCIAAELDRRVPREGV